MLYFFYGEECPHCHNMMPLIDKMIESGKEIQKLETWHNEENAKKLQEFDDGKCGGVPFMYNDESQGWICGEADEAKLEAWANGESIN